jgi:hypothetical protein
LEEWSIVFEFPNIYGVAEVTAFFSMMFKTWEANHKSAATVAL